VKRIILPLVAVFSLVALWQCAHQVMPSGGPKDTKPPVIIEEQPPNGTVNFNSDGFSIKFDEFVELDNINNQLLISPPMLKIPDFKFRGKTLIVKFKEELKPNTTYSVYFGDAIVDITEKNPLKNYSYVFSTGNTLDSMSLLGTVKNAFDLKPVEDAYVMLYKDNNDTIPLDLLPLKVKPYYLSKTDKNGKFDFNALANEPYLVFALKDQNNSLTFDQPQEEIAFIDSLVRPQFLEKMKLDTAMLDTINNLPDDTVKMIKDSLIKIADSVNKTKTINHTLLMFKNQDTVQKLLQATLVEKNKLQFIFSLPADSVKIKPLNITDSLKYFSEYGVYRDTVTWFLKEPFPDTLNLLFVNGTDTLENMDIRVVPKQKNLRQKSKTPQKEFLSYSFNTRGIIKPGGKLILIAGQPVDKFIPDSVMFVSGDDTIYNPPYKFIDTLHRKILFPFKVKAATNYTLSIPDSSIIDWNGIFNKKILFSFKSKEDKEYGKLTLKIIPPVTASYILQMLDEKENLLTQRYLNSDTTFVFNYIDPAKYIFKIVFDKNGNRRWDTGNYLRKRQPEKVIFFNKKIEVKANWEYEEEWKVEQ
jgi:hypothetical protein